jgi:hypothetical protein
MSLNLKFFIIIKGSMAKLGNRKHKKDEWTSIQEIEKKSTLKFKLWNSKFV